jgi:hypothetical protein
MIINRGDAPSVYTLEESAEILRCEPGWLEEQAQQGKIPYLRLDGRLLFSDAHLVAIISAHEVLPHAEQRPEAEQPGPPSTLVYDARQAAAVIGGICKASWLKQQARDEIVPHVKLGGAYHFSNSHLAEIISIFEVRPKVQPVAQSAPATPPPVRTTAVPRVQKAPKLKARAPRNLRGRSAGDHPGDAT